MDVYHLAAQGPNSLLFWGAIQDRREVQPYPPLERWKGTARVRAGQADIPAGNLESPH